MICKKCGAENPDNYIFCQNCLADLPNPELEESMLFSQNQIKQQNSSKHQQPEQTENIFEQPQQEQTTTQQDILQDVQKEPETKTIFETTSVPEKKTLKILDTNELLDESANEQASLSKVSQSVYLNPDEPYLREPTYSAPKRKLKKSKKQEKSQPETIVSQENEQENQTTQETDNSTIVDDERVSFIDPIDTTAPIPAPESPSFSATDPLPAPESPSFSATDPLQDEIVTDPFFNEDAHEYPYKTYGAIKPLEEVEDSSEIIDETTLTKRQLKKIERQQLKDLKHKKQLEKQMSRGRSSYDYYDYYDYYDEVALKKERQRATIVNVLFWFVLVALIAITSFFIYRLAVDKFGSASQAINTIFGVGKIDPGPYEMNPSIENDTETHVLTIFAHKGDTITFNNILHTPIEIKETASTPIGVPDKYFLPDEPASDQEQISVSPSAVLKDTKGVSHEITIKPFMISVPQVNLRVNEPANPQSATAKEGETTLKISGMVSAFEPVALYLGDQDVSDKVKPDGSFEIEYEFQDETFNFDLVARALRHRSSTVSFSGTKPTQTLKVEIFPTHESITDKLETQIKGTVEPGSSLKVKGSIASDWAYDKLTGDFSFTAKLDKTGINEFIILAQNETETVSTEKQINIIRLPSIDSYSRLAQSLEYKAALNNVSPYINKTYMFVGEIKTIEQKDSYSIISIYIDGDENKKVQATYYGETIPVEGKSYRIFGDLRGITQDKTQLTVDVFFILSNTSQS